jgi:hypothetical protein
MYYRTKNWSHSTAYQPTVVKAPADATDTSRIEAIEKDARYDTLSEKDRSFVTSVKAQAAKHSLSPAQRSWLERVEKALEPVDVSWWNAEEGDNAKKREYAILHYSTTGYTVEITKMKADTSYMPKMSKWEAMWGNKFIGAGYKRWTDGPKHAVGDMVLSKLPNGNTHYTCIISNVKWGEGNKWHYIATFLDIPDNSYNVVYMNRELDVAEDDVKLLTRKKKK